MIMLDKLPPNTQIDVYDDNLVPRATPTVENSADQAAVS